MTRSQAVGRVPEEHSKNLLIKVKSLRLKNLKRRLNTSVISREINGSLHIALRVVHLVVVEERGLNHINGRVKK